MDSVFSVALHEDADPVRRLSLSRGPGACRQFELDPFERTFGELMSQTPNDDRSDSLNPNNDAYDASLDNRANQLNPNNEAYQGSDTLAEDEED